MGWETKFGRRQSDGLLILPDGCERAIVRTDVRFVDGYALEPIEAGRGGKIMGLVLLHKAWHPKLYFMNARLNWNEEDYFVFAAERIRLL